MVTLFFFTIHNLSYSPVKWHWYKQELYASDCQGVAAVVNYILHMNDALTVNVCVLQMKSLFLHQSTQPTTTVRAEPSDYSETN